MPELDEEEEEEEVVLRPLGEVIFVSGEGDDKRNHYQSFQYNVHTYKIGDFVLCEPEDEKKKPYVARIKEITETLECELMLTVQWFYRPEDAETTGGGTYESRFSRELLYSFHLDEVPAVSIMHSCEVFFIPLNKIVPERFEHAGFVVQRIYDFKDMKFYTLTDRDYEDEKQCEIDYLVQKTCEQIGYLPDLELESTAGKRGTKRKNKSLEPPEVMARDSRTKRKTQPLYIRDISPLDVSLVDGVPKLRSLSVETPGSTTSISLEYSSLLERYKLWTEDEQRNKWLMKLLGAINSKDTAIACVSTVTDLEKAAHKAFSADFPKYNQKMRQLEYNLKSNAELARRFLEGELEPEQIVEMSPFDLKVASTPCEVKSKEPEEFHQVQMTDAKCGRCSEEKVALACIYQAGRRNRYQLECKVCGNIWHVDVGTVNVIGLSTSSNSVSSARKHESSETNSATPSGAEDRDQMPL